MKRRTFLRLSAAALSTAALPLLGVEAGASASRKSNHVPVPFDRALPVHPLLQYGARAEPGKKVRVIVQKKTKAASGRKIAADAGATHLEEFGFIKSHCLEIQQKNILKLGQHKDVLYVSPSAPIQRHAKAIDASNLLTHYIRTTETDKAWNGGSFSATGAGVTVAVLDSGVTSRPEIATNLVPLNVNESTTTTADPHGHGTHVIGIIKGRDNAGTYIGVAPDARVVSVKIGDDTGAAHDADLLRGLEWCYVNRAAYALRVVNLSVCSSIAESYRTSPICAAVEQLWLAGVVVVVSVGNRGSAADATWYAPANDPYVIAVGATDDNMTDGIGDDTLAVFSSRGRTLDGISKPDIVAPGRRIYSVLASPACTIATAYPARIAPDGAHIRLSGTSMAAPVVSGIVALVLEKYPHLSPDQMKWLLRETWRNYGSGASMNIGGIGMADPNQALRYLSDAKNPLGTANPGLTPAYGLGSSSGSLVFTNIYWDNVYWDNVYWDNVYWDVASIYD